MADANQTPGGMPDIDTIFGKGGGNKKLGKVVDKFFKRTGQGKRSFGDNRPSPAVVGTKAPGKNTGLKGVIDNFQNNTATGKKGGVGTNTGGDMVKIGQIAIDLAKVNPAFRDKLRSKAKGMKKPRTLLDGAFGGAEGAMGE